MKLRAPFECWDEHIAIDLPGARAMFTTRHGGFSRGPFATLNLGRLTADEPEAVRRNRVMLQDRVGGRLAMIRQVHGPCVLRLVQDAREPPDVAEAQLELEQADGQATDRVGIAPMVLVADCLPIAVAGGGAVAVLHAGWRGLDAGVVHEGVRAVREIGAGGPLAAAIGPGAGGCCYEVGEDVQSRFASYGPQVRRGGNLDLKAIAREQLERAGVDSVDDAGLCTICQTDFFSHRRDHGVTGRQAGVAWLS